MRLAIFELSTRIRTSGSRSRTSRRSRTAAQASAESLPPVQSTAAGSGVCCGAVSMGASVPRRGARTSPVRAVTIPALDPRPRWRSVSRAPVKGSVVQLHRGPAAVSGDDGRRMPLARTSREGDDPRMIHEPEDLSGARVFIHRSELIRSA